MGVEFELNINKFYRPSRTDSDGAVPHQSDIIIQDSFTYVECFHFERLKEAVTANMRYFTSPPFHGYLNFIMSVVLSRGITR